MSTLEGKKAPAFKLEGNDGNTYSLDDFKGQFIVIFFYPKGCYFQLIMAILIC